MTEAQWLSSTDPAAMLAWKTMDQTSTGWRFASDRKLRLFACACCRSLWHLLTDERSRRAVEVAERYADGDATDDERRASSTIKPLWEGDLAAVVCCAEVAVVAANTVIDLLGNQQSPATQAALLRDVFGNPWRRIEPFILRWPYMQTALAIAQATYKERTPDGLLDPARLAVLSDALEEAGCDNEELTRHLRGWERCWACVAGGYADKPDIRQHCCVCIGAGWVRSDAPHVKGCWVIDLLLGKS